MGWGLNDLESLSTTWWSLYLRWLWHSQNLMELFWSLAKNQCNSWRMAVVWSWYGWDLLSKIFFVACMELVMMTILDMFFLLYTWLIPHLMAKISASVLMMYTAWWTVFVRGWLHIYTWDIDVAMSFLMLASVTMMTMYGEEDNCNVILSSCWEHFLSFFSLLAKLKEKQSGKRSTILEPGLNSGWKEEKAGKPS